MSDEDDRQSFLVIEGCVGLSLANLFSQQRWSWQYQATPREVKVKISPELF